MKKLSLLFLLLIPVLFYVGCTDKLDLDSFSSAPRESNVGGDTLYIQLNPIWTGFNKPQDIMVGREPFIYIADTENDRIVMMRLDGVALGVLPVKRPVAIAQDYELNLIVCAQFDTVLSGTTQTFPAVYKVDMVAGNHIIANAPVTRLLPRVGVADDFNTALKYTGAAVMYDNRIFITRTGPVNNNIFKLPDNSILYFERKTVNGVRKDTLIGRVPLIEPLGTGLLSANNLSSISTFQRRTQDLLVTITGENSFKTQWFSYIETQEFAGYVSKLQPGNADIMKVGFFGKPEDVTVDNSGNIFVVDSQKDSVFIFNSLGDEAQSFGGPAEFNAPQGIAFYDRTLYIADTGNNRILRFILSTDIR